ALRSTIPNANLYFLNPAGVIFGANASLDVQGSFHASTADYLGLVDGTRFSAVSPSDNQVLTTAAPEAFGFLGDTPKSVTLAQAELKVPSGESLSLIGGEINLEGGQLIALGGRIDIASVSSRGEVIRQDNDLRLDGFEQLGRIELNQSAKVNASGEGGGAIFIRGGELTLNESVVISETLGGDAGKAIDLDLVQSLEIQNGGSIVTRTVNSGNGGDLLVTAQNIDLIGDEPEFTTGLTSESTSTGNGGSIKVRTDSLNVMNHSGITAITSSTGNGGNILLEANSMMLSGDGTDAATTGVFTVTSSGSSGNAGDLIIRSNSIDADTGAKILTATSGSGTGGTLLIEANELNLLDSETSIDALSFDTGDSKDITIKTDLLEIQDGATINSFVMQGTGKGANLMIEANNIILAGSQTGLFGGSFNDSNAGMVNLLSENIEIRNGAQVSTLARGNGNGGVISVTAGNILLSDSGGLISEVDSNSRGNAGEINIKADNLQVRNRAFIRTSTDGAGNGGKLSVTADNILISGGMLISRAGSESNGDAGNIVIHAENFEISNGPGISNATEFSVGTATGIDSDTDGSGKGGDITIEAGNILLAGKHSSISAETADTGKAGNVLLSVDSLEIRNGAGVSLATDGSGHGGDLLITAKDISLSNGKLVSDVRADSSGNPGMIGIETNTLEVRNGSLLSVFTAGSGSGRGEGVVVNTGLLVLSGDGAADFTGILTGTMDKQDASDVRIDATFLDILDGASIETSTFGAGNSGEINIEGKDILLSGDASGRDTGLFSRSSAIGNAGEITIMADDSLSILNSALISVETETADAGNINIEADSLLQLRDSTVTTSVAEGKGNGGNIFIGQQPDGSEDIVRIPNITVLDNSQIIAQAAEGQGGKIGITSDNIFKPQNSVVDASSRGGGIDGIVNITSPEANISGSIVALPETYINASEHLSERCAARSANVSSFVVKDRSTIRPGPEDASPSTFFYNGSQSNLTKDTIVNRDRFVTNNQLVTRNPDRLISSVNHASKTESGCTQMSDDPGHF
ncbi:MAG: hypothetical protein V3V18_08875, partial [Methylococcales bacterium]